MASGRGQGAGAAVGGGAAGELLMDRSVGPRPPSRMENRERPGAVAFAGDLLRERKTFNVSR